MPQSSETNQVETLPPVETPPVETPPVEAPPVEAPPVDDRVKKDMLRYKDENAQLKKQLEDIKIKGHKEKEDWQAVAEHHEQKASEYEQKYTGLQNALVNEKKNMALSIEAQKQGINPASLPDLELLDFEEVQVETTSSGKIMVSGQDRAIARLKTLRPHWFTKTIPSVNPSSPNLGKTSSGLITVADLDKAEAQYRKTRSEGDRAAYSDMIKKYKAQHG